MNENENITFESCIDELSEIENKFQDSIQYLNLIHYDSKINEKNKELIRKESLNKTMNYLNELFK
jgi:hypothetical protein